MFPGEDQSRSCKCMRWYGDVWARGAVMTGKCRAYLWVPLKRVSCTLSWMQMFPIPFNAFLLFYLISFSFKRIAGGHCPGMVTSGDSVTHKHFMEMRRLAHDETPFSWLCRQEPLPWHGDQMNSSVIPLHAHGPNRLARDETPYPPTRS
jgi:hypothetical protein